MPVLEKRQTESADKNLMLLLSGQLVSQIGDKIHMLAVALMVLETTGSPAKMGMILSASVLPGMIMGPASGAFLDRHSKKHIIVGADVARGAVVCLLCLLYMSGSLSFSVLLAAQALISVCTAFFDPAIPAIIPLITDRDRLTQANSGTQLISGIATVTGPALGGILVAWGGYLPVFAINGFSYLCSAGFESFIVLPPGERGTIRNSTLGEDILEGFSYLAGRKHLAVIVIMVGVIHLFVGSVEAVIPVLANALDGEGPANMGAIQSFFGVGTIVGAVVLGIKGMKSREVVLLFGSVCVIGLLLAFAGSLVWSGVGQVFPFFIVFLFMGAALVSAGTGFRSILQGGVDASMTGRVFGLVAAVGNSSIPLALLVTGFLMERFPPEYILFGSGILLIPISLSAFSVYRGLNVR